MPATGPDLTLPLILCRIGLVTPYELEERAADAPNVMVVDIAGELDLTNAEDVERRLEALSADSASAVVLDVNRVLFIDSAALHVLFRTARRLGRDRFGLVLDPNGAIARTLEILRISEVATVAGSHDELVPLLAVT